MNPRAVAVPLCDEFHEVSTSDVDGPVRPCVRARSADAVTTTGSEVSLKATADVAARLRLPFYADPETVRRCQDKDEMRAAYAADGRRGAGLRALRDASRRRWPSRGRGGFPLVVKPSRGWGQRGVARVDDETRAAAAFEEARAHSASAGLPLGRRRGVARGARVLGERLDRGRGAWSATA